MLVQPELIEKETTWELEDKMRKKKKTTQSCSTPIGIPRTESYKEGRM